MRELVFGSVGVLDRERVQVRLSVSVDVRVELVSLAPSAAATVLHLDEVQWATDRCMHVLEFPISVFLLSLSNLSLPNLSVIILGIFLCLSSHLQVSLVVLNLGVELRFLDVSLVLQLFDLLQQSLLGCAESRASGFHVLLNMKESVLVVSITSVRVKVIHILFEHLRDVTLTFSEEVFVDIKFGSGFIRSLVGVEARLHIRRIHNFLGWLVISGCQKCLGISHVLIGFHCVEIKELLKFVGFLVLVGAESKEVIQ